MTDYKDAVGPALNKELTKMFVTYKALVLIDRSEVPPDATFFRFFCFLKNKFLPDHSFERMSARLCAMEVTPSPPDADTGKVSDPESLLFYVGFDTPG